MGDCLLLFLYFRVSEGWEDDSQRLGFLLLACWMLMSKFIKLMGHYIRYPADFLLLPVSILFGYLHGLIKVYAMLTLNVVRWILHFGALYRKNISLPGGFSLFLFLFEIWIHPSVLAVQIATPLSQPSFQRRAMF